MLCPPEESVKQVKLNTALISYRCSHLPLTRDWCQKVSTAISARRHLRNGSDSVTGCKLSGIYCAAGDHADNSRNPASSAAWGTVALLLECFFCMLSLCTGFLFIYLCVLYLWAGLWDIRMLLILSKVISNSNALVLCSFEHLSKRVNHGQHGGSTPRLLLGAVGFCRNFGRNSVAPLAQHSLRGLKHHHSHFLHERPVDGVCMAQHWHIPMWAVQISTGTAARPAGTNTFSFVFIQSTWWWFLITCILIIY